MRRSHLGVKRCNYNKFPGWYCSRERNHPGPCALRTYVVFVFYLAHSLLVSAYLDALWICGLFICERCRYLLPRRLRAIERLCRTCYKKIIFRHG